MSKKCNQCSKEFKSRKKPNQTFCSYPCWLQSKVGKVRRNYHGYNLVHLPDHKLANHRGDVLQHRLVVMESLGRYLEPYEIVHHKNGIKDDNRIENLEIILQYPKNGFHKGEIDCPYCRKKFSIK